MLLSGWASPLDLLKAEVTALEYEGVKVPADLKKQIMLLEPASIQEESLTEFRSKLEKLSPAPDFPYTQPNELAEIRSLRPKTPEYALELPSDDKLLDLFHGAWLGRCAGCALGKPVEGLSSDFGRKALRNYLELRNDWPLSDYFRGVPAADGITLNNPECWRENITHMIGDDDINYTLVALTVLEQYGSQFGWQDVAETWDNLLPYNLICTAETQAILNYHTRKQRILWQQHQPVTAEYTRSTNNPYREWIGAQIRADFWGWAAAGDPERAAEFAWRDASWTHTRNGIYGEMFMAALEAAAFAEHDIHKLIEIALAQIPASCRLAEEIRLTMQKADELDDFDRFIEWHDEHFAGMHTVHTVNNASLVVMALLLGKGDPDRSICLAVAAGLDTDCNGATVGAIMGILTGAKNFGGILAPRLNDRLKTGIAGFMDISLTDLAKRTLAVHQKIR